MPDDDADETTPDDDQDGDGQPDDGESLPEIDNPEAYVKDALGGAMDDLEEIDDDTDPVEAVTVEKQVFDGFATDAAAAVLRGFPEKHAKAAGSELSKSMDVYTKSDVLDGIADEIDDLRDRHPNATNASPASGGSGGQTLLPLDQWVAQHLDRVAVIESTDARQETTYRWHFDRGIVETAADREGVTHFSWTHFRDEIYQALGVNCAQPKRKETEAWRQFIAGLVETRGHTQETVGARSHAVRQVVRHIEAAVGYTDLADAAERGGVQVVSRGSNGSNSSGGSGGNSSGSHGPDTPDGPDDTPDDEAGESGAGGGSGGSAQQASPDGGAGGDEVRVLWSDIARITDDAGVTVRALQSELDARGLTHPRIAGVSETGNADGTRVDYWVFDAEIGEPAEVVDEPESPAAKVSGASHGGASRVNAGNADAGHVGGIGEIPGEAAPPVDESGRDADADEIETEDADADGEATADESDATDATDDTPDGEGADLADDEDEHSKDDDS